MKIQIRLLSSLKRFAPGREGLFRLELEDGATVAQLSDRLNIPSSVKRVVLVNGYHGNEDTVLAENDQVTLFPPMGGG